MKVWVGELMKRWKGVTKCDVSFKNMHMQRKEDQENNSAHLDVERELSFLCVMCPLAIFQFMFKVRICFFLVLR